ncbi:DUF4410 domain-containing protein [Pseudoduganella sp. RAF53_2]|uniref:DUF4410 domain-containing protein n=1 Tax=unclassified Pseudoduganella TaxID=2637179 RepID=UPI003F9BCED5
MFKKLAAIGLVLALTGCASGVKVADNAHRQFITTQPANAISISLTDDAKKKLSDNMKFNQTALLEQVKRALTAKNMLNENQAGPMNTIEIVVKDMRVRSSFTAVMFGFMAGNDSLTGDVVLKDVQGKELNRFEVSASYALGGLAGGQDESRMNWLYEKFAEHTVENLGGTAKN